MEYYQKHRKTSHRIDEADARFRLFGGSLVYIGDFFHFAK